MGWFNRKSQSSSSDTVMTGAQAARMREEWAKSDAVHAASRDKIIATKDANDATRSGDAAAAAGHTVAALEAEQRLAHARDRRCSGHDHR